jgi:TonB family protein
MDTELESGISSAVQFAEVDRALRVRPLLFSALAHCLAVILLGLFVALQRSRPVLVLPAKNEKAQIIQTAPLLPPSAGHGISLSNARKKAKRTASRIRVSGEESTMGVAAVRALAKRETVGLVNNFKFRTIYGFSPRPKYELPVQTSGQYPIVSSDELPPRFEQYLIVEITIDSEGRVIDARITAGEVEKKIATKVLAAVRQFKYRPATKEGIPIPSQTDLVIHIPT